MMERSIHWYPGYDHRQDPEKRSYGQRCPHIHFVVKNEMGALAYEFYTNIYINDPNQPNALPSNRLVWHVKASDHPLGSIHTADYHDQTPQDCVYVGKCVGSSTQDWGNELLRILCIGDMEEFWTKMEEKHREIIK